MSMAIRLVNPRGKPETWSQAVHRLSFSFLPYRLHCYDLKNFWDTIDDCHINNLAKNQVSAVFHSRVICRSVSSKIYRALYGDAMFVSFMVAVT